MAGQQSLSAYSIGEQLGTGAQGTIFEGINLQTNETVAIKIFDLTKDSALGAFAIEFFIHKIMKEKAIRICETIEFFQVPKQKGYMVMKKYQQDLFDLAFESSEKLSMKNIKKIFKRICRGVRDLHKKGVAHLDLKPENILLDENKKPVLCDFGCSYVYNVNYQDPDNYQTRLSKETRKTCFVKLYGRGTRTYAAPEVFDSTEFNPFSADIYSLGIILFALITGGFPYFQGKEVNIGPAKNKLSKRGLLLLSKMLSVDPSARPSIESVVDHPWLHSSKQQLKTKISSDTLVKFNHFKTV